MHNFMMDTQLTKRVSAQASGSATLRSLTFPAEKRGGERPQRNVADLQAHKASEKGESGTGADPSKEVPPRHLRVRY